MENTITKKVLPAYQRIKNELREKIFRQRCDTLSESQIIRNFGVSSATARRVLDELSEEGIVIRKVGRGTLVVKPEQQTVNLGILFFDFVSVKNPYITEITKGIEQKAIPKSYHLSFYTTRNKPLSEMQNSPLYHSIVKKKLDGVFILSPLPIKDLQFLQDNGIPLVVVNNEYPTLNLNTVIFNHYQAFRRIMEYLFQTGYQKIALMVGPSGEDAQILRGSDEAIKGYRDFLSTNQMFYNPEMVIKLGHAEKDGYLAMQKIASLPPGERPKALIVYSEELSKGVFRYLNESGQDLNMLLILSAETEHCKPPFISRDLQLLGGTAFEVLDKNRAEPKLAPKKISVPLKIVWEGGDALKTMNSE